MMQRFLGIHPDPLELAEQAFQNNEYKEVINHCNRALTKEPSSYRPLYLRSVSHFRLEQFNQAGIYAEIALNSLPRKGRIEERRELNQIMNHLKLLSSKHQLELAEAAFLKKDYAHTLGYCKTALQGMSDSYRAHYLQSLSYFHLKQFNRASLDAATKALSLISNEASTERVELISIQAASHFQLGHIHNALELANQVLGLNPKDETVLLLRARCHLYAMEYEKAIEDATQLPHLNEAKRVLTEAQIRNGNPPDPNLIEDPDLKALALQETGRFAEALETVDSVDPWNALAFIVKTSFTTSFIRHRTCFLTSELRAAPYDIFIRLYLTDIEAFKDSSLQSLLKYIPSDQDLNYKVCNALAAIGKKHMDEDGYGNVGKGLIHFVFKFANRSLELKPQDNPEALKWKGFAHLCEAYSCDNAILSFNASLALKQDPEVLNGRAVAHYMTGNWDAAFADADQALGLGRSNTELFAIRGHSLYEQKRFEEAIPDLLKGLDSNNNKLFTTSTDRNLISDTTINRALGWAYASTGESKEAIKALDKICCTKQDDLLLSKLLIETKQFERAASILDVLIRVYPEDVDFLTLRARVYCACKDFARALSLMEKQTALKDTPLLHELKAEIAAAEGRKGQALLHTLRKIELTPNRDRTLEEVVLYALLNHHDVASSRFLAAAHTFTRKECELSMEALAALNITPQMINTVETYQGMDPTPYDETLPRLLYNTYAALL